MEQFPSPSWATPPWFLVTPPRPGTTVKVRPRLHELLSRSTNQYRLTLIGAPSGFGKTSVLSTWAASMGNRIAWLGLTWMSAVDERQILGGILGALQRLRGQLSGPDAQVLDRLNAGSLSPDELLQQLCVLGAELSEPVVIVIDDAHLAHAQRLQQTMAVLSEHSGHKLRLVLSGADNFAANFATQLRNGDALLIGPEELAFTEAELCERYDLDAAQAAKVFAQSAGWPISVHLSTLTPIPLGLAEQTAEQFETAETREELVQYVQDVVLRQLPQQLCEFVLATTTSLRLDASLAYQLSANPQATQLLEECVGRGLFLERYLNPTAETSYRWYGPFAKICQILLRRSSAAQAVLLNRSAARALRHSDPLEAIHHSLLARDVETCSEIIRTDYVRILCESGAQLLNSACLRLAKLAPLPADLLMIRACALDAMGDFAGASVIQRTVDAMGPRNIDQERIVAFCGLFLARSTQELTQAVDWARKYLPHAEASPEARAYQMFSIGWSELRLRRDTVGAVRLLRSALNDARALELDALAQLSRSNLAFALSFGGNFVAARKLTQEYAECALAIGSQSPGIGWKIYDGGIKAFTLEFLDFWQGNREACAQHFAQLLQVGGHGTSYLALGCVFNALLAATSNDLGAIKQAREHLERVGGGDQHGLPWGTYKTFGKAVLKAASDDVTGAITMLEPYKNTPNIPVVRVCAAEIYRLAGKPDEALAWIAQLKPAEMASYVAVCALVTSAAIARERGDRILAHEQLERALDLAAPANIAMPFTPRDEVVRTLLTEHAAWGTAHETFLAPRIGLPTSLSRTELLGSQLSSREREIFGYLCTTMTAEEIAVTLFVSVNTVRTHQRSIYRKLGVNSRRDAIKLTV